MKVALTANITEEQICKEFPRLGMEQLIAQDLSKRYYHNELTYRDLENLEKQFDLKFENLDFKIDTVKNELNTKIDNVEKNLNTKIDNLSRDIKQNLDEKLEIFGKFLSEKIETNNQLLSEKLKVSNRIITIAAIVVISIAISMLVLYVVSLIGSHLN